MLLYSSRAAPAADMCMPMGLCRDAMVLDAEFDEMVGMSADLQAPRGGFRKPRLDALRRPSVLVESPETHIYAFPCMPALWSILCLV